MIIAHVITRLLRGGADENTVLSCNAQAASGHEVHLIYGNHVSFDMLGKVDAAVHLHQVSNLVRPVRPLRDLRALLAIRRLLRDLNPDIVHTHTSKAGIIGRVAARLAGLTGIVHGVHILPFINVGGLEKAVYLTAERAAAPFTKAFVNVSAGMRDACLANGIGNASSHFVVPSGMDIQVFLDATPLDREELSEVVPEAENNDIQLILMVAALEARKRVIEFLPVFLRVLDSRPNARLVVLGEGIDRKRVESAINASGLSNRVFLAGFRTDVERWIARADVCVLSSEREGLPRAVVQYAAGACPCVVTALPGVEVVVRHGETGFLIDSDDLEGMVDPITRILSEPMLARDLRDQARQLDLLPWSVKNMALQLDAVYARVLTTN